DLMADAAPLLAAEDIVRTAAARMILDGVSFAVAEGERVGLLGANGAGKTTLLRLLGGLESPEEGRISRRRGVRLGYLAQDAPLDAETSDWREDYIAASGEAAVILAHDRAFLDRVVTRIV